MFVWFSGNEPKHSYKKAPNIIIFFTEDQGYADLGCYGAEGFETSNIDKLAADAIRFTDLYVPAMVCTPSRAGLLTGRYPKRSGLHEAVLLTYSEGGLKPEEYTMADMLKENNYTTSCIGKWHLGHLPQFMPNNNGFRSFMGCLTLMIWMLIIMRIKAINRRRCRFIVISNR